MTSPTQQNQYKWTIEVHKTNIHVFKNTCRWESTHWCIRWLSVWGRRGQEREWSLEQSPVNTAWPELMGLSSQPPCTWGKISITTTKNNNETICIDGVRGPRGYAVAYRDGLGLHGLTLTPGKKASATAHFLGIVPRFRTPLALWVPTSQSTITRLYGWVVLPWG